MILTCVFILASHVPLRAQVTTSDLEHFWCDSGNSGGSPTFNRLRFAFVGPTTGTQVRDIYLIGSTTVSVSNDRPRYFTFDQSAQTILIQDSSSRLLFSVRTTKTKKFFAMGDIVYRNCDAEIKVNDGAGRLSFYTQNMIELTDAHVLRPASILELVSKFRCSLASPYANGYYIRKRYNPDGTIEFESYDRFDNQVGKWVGTWKIDLSTGKLWRTIGKNTFQGFVATSPGDGEFYENGLGQVSCENKATPAPEAFVARIIY
jgi:hypothetical protein